MYALLIKQFIRSKTVIISTVLILALGLVSILIGDQFLAKQEKAITEVTQHQEEHIERNVKWHNDEIGLLLYYIRFALINTPEKLAALSIGQRDINSSIQSVTIRNLEGQKYDTDLNNPANLQSGNLDLGFVIIYLFPLLIIAFTFDLLSEEKERETWRLVAIQSPSIRSFLLSKLSIRMILLYSVLLLLFVFAILTLSLPINEALLAFIILSILYLAFWFALCFWIVSLQRPSSFNILSLLSLWVVLAILMPASVNNFVANQYPVPEALSTMVQQRDGYHEKWDMDKNVTIDKFFAHYPQFKGLSWTGEGFDWLWYFAMQQMGDDESREQSEAMREKIMQREMTSRNIARFIPSMHAQLLLNDIARTSLGNHMEFMDQTNEFHENLRMYFYPRIFKNASVEAENWAEFRPEYFSDTSDIHWTTIVLPFLISVIIFSIISIFNLKKVLIV